MAKSSMIAREHKRARTVKRFAARRAELKAIIINPNSTDEERMAAVMRILSSDERVGKSFIEPHLVQSLQIAHPRIRFQGCRAARHDDHIHFQL